MKASDVQELLRKEVLDGGGVNAWASAHAIDQAAVSNALKGHRPPNTAILSALGLVKSIEYRKANPDVMRAARTT